MKNSFIKRLSAVLVTAAVATAVVLPICAAEKTYDGLSADTPCKTFTFDKYLILDKNYNVPDATFNFELAASTTHESEGTKEGIVTGVKFGGDAISSTNQINVEFSHTDTTYTNADLPSDYNVTLTADQKCVKKSATIDFSGVAFTEPGIYEYTLTENIAGTGSASVDDITRYLYVLVEDDSTATEDHLKLAGYFLSTAGLDASAKSDGFRNRYPSFTLTFGKEVTGNQGSKDKYFKFTLKTTTDIPDTDVFAVDMTNATTNPTKTTATVYEASVMADANDVITITGAQLKAGKDFYLQDGDYITILGLPENLAYEVTEVSEDDYTAANGISAANSSLDYDGTAGYDALSDLPSGTISANVYTGFTNNKEGVIPTGIILSALPVIIVGIVVAGGVVFFAVRNAKRKAEEASEADAE